MTYDLCSTLQNIFRKDPLYLPLNFLNLYSMMSDGLMIILDNYVAINIVSCYFNSGAIIVPIVISLLQHFIIYCVMASINNTINDIKNPLKENIDLEKIDSQIETIFNEMNILSMDVKSS